MQSFIVLGIIPGTNLQLTFNFWLYVAILLVCWPMLRSLWRQRASLHTYYIALVLSRFISQYQLPA
jgi:hypothetical protein